MSFAGKVALVTGGTSGMGRETAIEFVKAGARVVLAGRRQQEGAAASWPSNEAVATQTG